MIALRGAALWALPGQFVEWSSPGGGAPDDHAGVTITDSHFPSSAFSTSIPVGCLAGLRVGTPRRATAFFGLAILAPALGVVGLALPAKLAAASPPAAAYIVEGASAQQAAAAVNAAGGTVTASLPIIDAVAARLSPGALRTVLAGGRLRVVADGAARATGGSYVGQGPTSHAGLATQLARMDLGSVWSDAGGSGIGVALIDTGVAATPGITRSRLVRSPDFSGGGPRLDGYGHGTFMAGLIAGNGTGGPSAVPGVAPGVTLVSVKVARSDGATTIGDVIAGIGWAVEHKELYNIKVMSISFGADMGLPPSADPLDHAVQAAWAAGITVVAAAGNSGAGHVTSPGDDPAVITVGAESTTGPYSSPSWSGYSESKPDVLAPAVDVESLRSPGSRVDTAHPEARVGGLYFIGSGTSMATALTAGAAALVIHDHPDATPDQIKAALLASEGPALVGRAGPIDVAAADRAVGSAGSAGSASTAATVPAGSSASPAGPWQTMTWETMTWETMTWETMTWEDEGW